MNNDFSNGNWPAFNPLLDYFFFFSTDYLHGEICSQQGSLIYSRSKSSQRGRFLDAQATRTRIRAGRPGPEITATSTHMKHQPRGVSLLRGPARTRWVGEHGKGTAQRRAYAVCVSAVVTHIACLVGGPGRSGILGPAHCLRLCPRGGAVGDRHPSPRRVPLSRRAAEPLLSDVSKLTKAFFLTNVN